MGLRGVEQFRVRIAQGVGFDLPWRDCDTGI